jgi:hypothetical protein
MKMKIRLMLLPLLCAAGVAMAQGAEPGAAAAPDATQAPDSNQVQPGTHARDGHHRHMGKRRQGRDMRRCLKLKTNAAIIRCAEPGRKP